MKKGLFISFEGIEGSGKTTQARLLKETLGQMGIEAALTLEPGGTRLGKKIRNILLDPGNAEIAPVTELLLYLADRGQHIKEVILPCLSSGMAVITDRYSDSTVAYQGHGRGMDAGLIAELGSAATGGLMPDITFVLDIEVETGLRRIHGGADRLELEDIGFHRRVREGFLSISRMEPRRVKLVDARGTVEETHGKVVETLLAFMKEAP